MVPNDEVNRPCRQQGGRRRSVIRSKGGYLQIVPAGSELNGVLGEIVGGTTGEQKRSGAGRLIQDEDGNRIAEAKVGGRCKRCLG